MANPSVGGAFNPAADYSPTGQWTFSVTPVIGSGAYVTTGATQTLTNKSLTSPTITGTVGGVATLRGMLYGETQFCTTEFAAVTSTAGGRYDNLLGPASG